MLENTSVYRSNESTLTRFPSRETNAHSKALSKARSSGSSVEGPLICPRTYFIVPVNNQMYIAIDVHRCSPLAVMKGMARLLHSEGQFGNI